MLFHALRSRYIDPGRPPAADGGLRSQYPDLVLGAQQPLDCRQLRQAERRVLTRSFDTRSKASIELVASAITISIKPGRRGAGRRSLIQLTEPPRHDVGRGRLASESKFKMYERRVKRARGPGEASK